MFLRSSVLVLPIEMHGAVATRELVMVREWESLNAKAELARMHRDRHCHEAMVLFRPPPSPSRCKHPDENKQSHAERELPKGDDPRTVQSKGVHSYLPGWQPKEKEA